MSHARADRAAAGAASRSRSRIRVEGVVQGVGFRPFVYRLARELDLDGWVLNDEHGVLVEAEGEAEHVRSLIERIEIEAPPLADVGAISSEAVAATGSHGFEIAESAGGGEPEALVSADFATCEACLAEVRDPGDRRWRYPFANCTDCGPRFTIVRGVPYDRPLTTMAGFEMCPACRAEYEDPLDRRFHAQPIACPRCGPRARLLTPAGDSALAEWTAALPDEVPTDAVSAAAAALAADRVVAIKGLGGYHLACRADDERAVGALRARKHREEKPFALMVADTAAAREFVELSGPELELLTGPERPIVIARRRPRAWVAPQVAPYSSDLGVMLPYTPLHHLLLADFGTITGRPSAALVMTSGNVSDEPIAFEDDDAAERLGPIADLMLTHDRPIEVRTDDSVVRSLDPGVRAAPLLIRRSRGRVPAAIPMPVPAKRAILGVGAELKSTFCLAKGERAWVGHHIGDLKNWETLRSFRSGVTRFERLFAVEPAVVAHDEHPDYLSTGYAQERAGLDHVAVQHHHAHLASCLAEHGHEGRAIGAIFDGSGHGPDGTVWGGELLVGDLAGYERRGLLMPVRLPGGDAAVREPWRLACSWLAAVAGDGPPERPVTIARTVGTREWEEVCELVRSGVSSPLTSSAGRLFDAVAALCGIRARVEHEGQAAMELEGLSDRGEREAYPLEVLGDRPVILDARPTVAAVVRDVELGVPVRLVGARFHNALARATAEACRMAAEAEGVDTVVLSGGVFQNRLLLERTHALLDAAGIRVLIPELLPPNDGGISYGQVAVAAAREEAVG